MQAGSLYSSWANMASLYKHWEMSQYRCKSLQIYVYGFPIQIYGKLQSAITWIQRRESTIPAIEFLVLIHSTCLSKKLYPQVLPVPPWIRLFIIIFFFYLVCSFYWMALCTKKPRDLWPHVIPFRLQRIIISQLALVVSAQMSCCWHWTISEQLSCSTLKGTSWPAEEPTERGTWVLELAV